jgi:hypothetical protein
MYAHAHDMPPAPSSVRPELPKAVDEAVLRALAKDPASRPATATEFVGALEAAFMRAPGQTMPAPVRTSGSPVARWVRDNRPLAIVGSALGVVALVVAAAALGGDPNPDPSPTAGPAATSTTAPGATSTVADVTGPTGGGIAIQPTDGFTDLVDSLAVQVVIDPRPTDPSGVASFMAANAPSRPPLTEAQPIADAFPWTLATGSGRAGERSVYVWFADRAGNWTTTPLEATILFDNPPVVHNDLAYNRRGEPYCTTFRNNETITLVLLPHLASDPDDDDLRIVRLWTRDPVFAEENNLTFLLDPTGQQMDVVVNNLGAAEVRLTDYFTVRDSHGVERDGFFHLDVGGCPT